MPLARYGLIGSWLLMFLIFEREYSTGVYLLSPGTETIGSMLVSLWAAGAIDIVAALSFINIAFGRHRPGHRPAIRSETS